jgi:hypothetical protein
MSEQSKPRWLHGVAVYQDVVLEGRTVRTGSRDCRGAWEAMATYLPQSGAILDVGSNFGWFGLQVCQAASECVVASVEADERSATVQRRVLESNRSERICLLTQRAGLGMARRFAAVGQRFDTVLCLAVLHWMADHREFLAAMGTISRRLFVEQPDPDEQGAGVERIRQEIGAVGPYLEALFPNRPRKCLGQLRSPRDGRFTRELWFVDEPPGWPAGPSSGLDISALLRMSPSWPPQSWWDGQLRLHTQATSGQACLRPRILFTPCGMQADSQLPGTDSLARLRRLARRIPERQLLRPTVKWYRGTCRSAGRFLRQLLPE